ncbi:MAG TPA: rhomboid family intramembrane serine protease [Gaiellaceae bacterium]
MEAEPTTQPRYCYRHPDRETGLSCSECGRPICYECMTPAPVGLRCPEHSGKPQGVRRVTTAAARATTGTGARTGNLVTLTLIGINMAVFALELALGGTLSGTGNWIYEHGVLVRNALYGDGTPAGVANGEWWRLETATFLHYGLIHLAMNMFSLYFAGSILEQVIGRWRFLLLYVVSGLAGSAGALLLSKPTALTAGASGAIFGILGGLLVLERRGRIATGGQVLGLIVLNLVITFAIPGISVGGHLGGLVGGIVLMLAFDRFRYSPRLSVASALLVAVGAVLVAYAAI